MSISVVYIGIIFLFVISFIVRILPSIISLNLSERVNEDIRSFLPAAVFINLIVYCFSQELNNSLLASLVSFVFMLIVFKKAGLILSVIMASVIYLVVDKNLIALVRGF